MRKADRGMVDSLTVPEAFRARIVDATIQSPAFWPHVRILKLTTNMRLSRPNIDPLERPLIQHFATWMRAIGTGGLGSLVTGRVADDFIRMISIPD
jgi:hypothetical protein